MKKARRETLAAYTARAARQQLLWPRCGRVTVWLGRGHTPYHTRSSRSTHSPYSAISDKSVDATRAARVTVTLRHLALTSRWQPSSSILSILRILIFVRFGIAFARRISRRYADARPSVRIHLLPECPTDSVSANVYANKKIARSPPSRDLSDFDRMPWFSTNAVNVMTFYDKTYSLLLSID